MAALTWQDIQQKYRWPDGILWIADTKIAKVRAEAGLLKKGIRDAGVRGAVQLLQLALLMWGASHKQVKENLLPNFLDDGDYGKNTAKAVEAFQKENLEYRADGTKVPLMPDGIVGHRTLSALDHWIFDKKTYNSDVIEVAVDIVAFPDGLKHGGSIGKLLQTANKVFKRAGIRFRLGTVVTKDDARAMAGRAFENNQGKGGGSSSVIDAESATSLDLTDEMERLANDPARPSLFRPTVYFTAPFPSNVHASGGFTFITGKAGLAATVIVPDRYDREDVFWHELGHVLLAGSGLPDDDHHGKFIKHGPNAGHNKESFMETPVGPDKRFKAMSKSAIRAMRDQAKRLRNHDF